MKPLSTDPDLITTGAAAAQARPASFDRQLASGHGGAGWGDPALDRQLAEAARAGHQQGLARGYAEGFARGRKEAAERAVAEAAAQATALAERQRGATQRAHTLLTSLAEAARSMREATAPAWHEVADALAGGAVEIATAIVARELTTLDAPVIEAVRTALRTMPPGPDLVLHVHPDDVWVLSGQLGDAATPGHDVTVIPDTSVAPGTVVAQNVAQRLNVDFGVAVRAAQEVLAQ